MLFLLIGVRCFGQASYYLRVLFLEATNIDTGQQVTELLYLVGEPVKCIN
jgi:hypothetical protein